MKVDCCSRRLPVMVVSGIGDDVLLTLVPTVVTLGVTSWRWRFGVHPATHSAFQPLSNSPDIRVWECYGVAL